MTHTTSRRVSCKSTSTNGAYHEAGVRETEREREGGAREGDERERGGRERREGGEKETTGYEPFDHGYCPTCMLSWAFV